VGPITLHIDPTTSPRPETFPSLEFEIVTISGVDNTLGMPIILPQIDNDMAKLVGGNGETFLENALYGRAGSILRAYEKAILKIYAQAFFSEVRFEVSEDNIEFKPVVSHSDDFVWPGHIVYDFEKDGDNKRFVRNKSKSVSQNSSGPFPGFLLPTGGDPPFTFGPSTTHKCVADVNCATIASQQ